MLYIYIYIYLLYRLYIYIYIILYYIILYYIISIPYNQSCWVSSTVPPFFSGGPVEEEGKGGCGIGANEKSPGQEHLEGMAARSLRKNPSGHQMIFP